MFIVGVAAFKAPVGFVVGAQVSSLQQRGVRANVLCECIHVWLKPQQLCDRWLKTAHALPHPLKVLRSSISFAMVAEPGRTGIKVSKDMEKINKDMEKINKDTT